jgi:hypothetical protein
MYDDAGFLTLSVVSFIAIAVSLSALIWAAVQDGRDERAFAVAQKRQRLAPCGGRRPTPNAVRIVKR